ncbi:hypothetical protein [Rubritalea tangerina]|uniref:hypothetical protein n=1 Tax=Rubritalea tangerina TaxID=430798 RepID=UPI00361543CD
MPVATAGANYPPCASNPFRPGLHIPHTRTFTPHPSPRLKMPFMALILRPNQKIAFPNASMRPNSPF